MRRYTALIISFIAALYMSQALAQTETTKTIPYVYRLKISGCDSEPTRRRQTGFRVQGTEGIVTALHGVVDCKTVNAISDDGDIFNGLEITQVDIERDVALLSSAELRMLPNEGLVPTETISTTVGLNTLRIAGYPLAAEKQKVDEIQSVRAIHSLDDTIPNAEEPDELRDRQSPTLSIMVLDLQAHLLPGHSGAPIVDENNQIIGIGNGGLRSGTVGHSWAIPWPVEFEPATIPAVEHTLDALAQKGYSTLSFSSTYPEQLSEQASITAQGEVESTSGQAIANAEVTLVLSDTYDITYTDTNGIYQFRLASAERNKLRRIHVEKAGYSTQEQTLINNEIPDRIRLSPLTPPLFVAFEIGDYARVVRSIGITLRDGTTDSSPPMETLSENQIVRVTGDPIQRSEQKWWKVCTINVNQRCGWIQASSSDAFYVEALPVVLAGEHLEVINSSSLFLYNDHGFDNTRLERLRLGVQLTVKDGPQESNGRLWYQVKTLEGIVGWVAFTGNRGVYFDVIESVPTATPVATATFTATPTAMATSTSPPRPSPTVTAGPCTAIVVSTTAATKISLRQSPTGRATSRSIPVGAIVTATNVYGNNESYRIIYLKGDIRMVGWLPADNLIIASSCIF